MVNNSDLQGLELNQSNSLLLLFLLNSLGDLDFFLINFFTSGKERVFAVLEYRLHKIRERAITFDEFESLFRKNASNALEELFQEPVGDALTNIIINKVAGGELSISTIFDKHKENIGLRVGRFVNGRRSI